MQSKVWGASSHLFITVCHICLGTMASEGSLSSDRTDKMPGLKDIGQLIHSVEFSVIMLRAPNNKGNCWILLLNCLFNLFCWQVNLESYTVNLLSKQNEAQISVFEVKISYFTNNALLKMTHWVKSKLASCNLRAKCSSCCLKPPLFIFAEKCQEAHDICTIYISIFNILKKSN